MYHYNIPIISISNFKNPYHFPFYSSSWKMFTNNGSNSLSMHAHKFVHAICIQSFSRTNPDLSSWLINFRSKMYSKLTEKFRNNWNHSYAKITYSWWPFKHVKITFLMLREHQTSNLMLVNRYRPYISSFNIWEPMLFLFNFRCTHFFTLWELLVFFGQDLCEI